MVDLDILKGKRILAVDDEPDVRDTIKESLIDCDVVTAGDFDAAKELIDTESFDLIITGYYGRERLCFAGRVPKKKNAGCDAHCSRC
jgi:hypothetical protein